MAYPTADTVLTQAQGELGLSATSFAAATTDALTQQMVALLVKAGQELAEEDWSLQRKTFTLDTSVVTGGSPYTLPADWVDYVDETAWDTTMQIPMVGPVTPQQWQALVARVGTAIPVGVPFKFEQGGLWLYPVTTPSPARKLTLMYHSAWWAAATGGAAPTADTPTAGTDLVFFPLKLAVAGLKLAWKREKQFDTTADQATYEEYLQTALDNDANAQPLSLNGSTQGTLRLVGPWNAPDTGWGASS